MSKQCSRCKLEKDESLFSKHSKMPGGLRSYCKECAKRDNRSYYEKNREKTLECKRIWYQEHRDDVLARDVDKTSWRHRNRDRYNKASRDRQHRKYHEISKHDPRFRLDDAMSSSIYDALRSKKNGRTWESLVGYSLDKLISHLESLFQPGMTWENYGKWHVDHIVPRSSFVYHSEIDEAFIKCWSLSNLQPLWAEENLRKGNKI